MKNQNKGFESSEGRQGRQERKDRGVHDAERRGARRRSRSAWLNAMDF